MGVVDGAAHTQKDDVESNGGSLENNAKVFALLLCGVVQLVLRSGVLTVLDLDEVDVTPRFADVFVSVLSGVGGSAGGRRCCWGAPSLPQLPPATPKNPCHGKLPPLQSIRLSTTTNTPRFNYENLKINKKMMCKCENGVLCDRIS